jgi:hypothetical protein
MPMEYANEQLNKLSYFFVIFARISARANFSGAERLDMDEI